MSESVIFLMNHSVLAALAAFSLKSYIIRLALVALAFGCAMNAERVVGRAIAFGFLMFSGSALCYAGFQRDTLIDLLLGLCVFGAAGYSWWQTRV